MNKDFGQYIKSKRELLLKTDVNYSQRQVAIRVGLEPTYLSQVERGLQNPPSEAKIIALAKDLDEDVNLLLALAGKVSDDLKKIIFRRY